MLSPGPHQREQRHDLRGVARRGADAADAALERGEALGQRHHRRVGQARVDEAELLEVEEPGGVVDVAEHVGGVLVDRRLPRAGRRVGLGAGVNLQRVEAHRLVGHPCPSLVRFGREAMRAGDGLTTAPIARCRAGRRGLVSVARTARRRCRWPTRRLETPPTRAPLHPRFEDTFPTLTAAEIERLRRFGERAALRRRRGAVRGRRAGAGDVRGAARARSRHAARRARAAAAAGRAGAGAVPRRGRAALGPAGAGRRPRRGRGRGDPDAAGGPAGAARRRGGARRADHPGADPAAGGADPERATAGR